MTKEKEVKEESQFIHHMRAAGKARTNQIKSLIPGEFWEYGREAHREKLLAFRSLLDGAIDYLETSETKGGQKPGRKTRVEVEQS